MTEIKLKISEEQLIYLNQCLNTEFKPSTDLNRAMKSSLSMLMELRKKFIKKEISRWTKEKAKKEIKFTLLYHEAYALFSVMQILRSEDPFMQNTLHYIINQLDPQL